MKLRIDMAGRADYLVYRWRYIGDTERKRLYDKAQEHIGIHYGELRIGDFFACLRCDFSVIGVRSTWNRATQAQYIWAMGFAEYMESLSKYLQGLTPPQTPEQIAAQGVCRKVDFEESVLVFCRSYFGLPSFRAVEDITVNEYIIAKKDRYNAAVYERKLNELYKLKQKQKK